MHMLIFPKKNKEEIMGPLELLKKIEDTYILNAPNIETMREFAYTAGYDVEYRYGFCRRW